MLLICQNIYGERENRKEASTTLKCIYAVLARSPSIMDSCSCCNQY